MLALPAVGGVVVLALPAAHARKPWIGARAVSLAFAAATLILAAMAAGWIDLSGGKQLVQSAPWLKGLGVNYEVAVTGITLPLVMMAAAMGAVACWAAYGVKQSVRGYFALLLWSLAAGLGTLVLQDVFMSAGAAIALVVTIYFLAVGWGGGRRVPAARRFLYFGIAGMAAALAGIAVLERGGVAAATAEIWFWVMAAGFGALMAAAPLHLWLADLLAECTTPVGMLVVSLVQTAGAFGILHVVHFVAAAKMPEAARMADGTLGWIGLAVAAYAILSAMGQKDLMRLAANFSVAQMGFFLMGIANGAAATEGAAFLLVAHGISAGMMVFVCGMIRERVGHCEIDRLGGWAGHMPAFAGWSAVGILGMAGVPGLCGFVGEMLVMLGIFGRRSDATIDFAAERHAILLGVSGLAAMAILMGIGVWMYQRVYMGSPRPEHSNVARMSLSERWILAVLGIGVAGLGIMPMVVTEVMRGAADVGK